jgi:hypothetical protein
MKLKLSRGAAKKIGKISPTKVMNGHRLTQNGLISINQKNLENKNVW